MESGEKDIFVSVLQKIVCKYGIVLDVLMFGEEFKMSFYFLICCGLGVLVEWIKVYKYQLLVFGFCGCKVDFFIVIVELKLENILIYFNLYEG